MSVDQDKKFKILLVSVIIIVGFEILDLFDIRLPEKIAPFFFGGAILIFGNGVLLKGAKALLKFNFKSINLLMVIAVAGAFYLGQYVEGAVVILVFLLGERLEDIGVSQSKSALEALVKSSPKTAILEEGTSVPVGNIQVGQIISVKPGEMMPLDGEVVGGETSVDEANITGEPLPKDKTVGDPVFAGTLNKQGFVKVKVTKKHEDSTFSKIIKITFEASANKSETQKFIERFSKVYTPSVVVIAVLLVAVPVLVFDAGFDKWLNQAITILVISCPCALVISTPVAVFAGIGKASEKGIVIKGGKFLELLGRVKAIGFDKTRTLTYGTPVVTDVLAYGIDDETLLSCLAGAEQFSEHPLAKAIVDAAKDKGYKIHPVEKFHSVVGKGAKAVCKVCEHKNIRVGNLDFIQETNKVSDKVIGDINRLQTEGKTAVVVVLGDEVRGVVGITDEIKPESADMTSELALLGVSSVMLTGDHKDTARYVAEHVGIKEYYAGLLPDEKADKVNLLKREYGEVAMVGDGVNDAPALALADVGIAMGAAGSDTAIEVAPVSLLNDRPSLIPFLIRLGRKMNRRIKINTVMAVSVKLLFLALALAGLSNLVMAIFADVGVMLIVIALSLRLRKFS
ncbi:copper-translocating P-type ATPase (plasmid) [Fulvitalea axinellae]|uniref:P-type Zn(2+) transporter n=1 Tax=Fulvitalea axinellae TaxID=1182444 RepID=A0AAU9CXC8_9BACT|nr:copper-translocating P-type ATPase [Fulvitalea axinellae]